MRKATMLRLIGTLIFVSSLILWMIEGRILGKYFLVFILGWYVLMLSIFMN